MRPCLPIPLPFISLSLSLCWGLLPGLAQGQDSGYRLPPKPVVDIIDAAPAPAVSFSPDREWMLMTQRNAMPGLNST